MMQEEDIEEYLKYLEQTKMPKIEFPEIPEETIKNMNTTIKELRESANKAILSFSEGLTSLMKVVNNINKKIVEHSLELDELKSYAEGIKNHEEKKEEY